MTATPRTFVVGLVASGAVAIACSSGDGERAPFEAVPTSTASAEPTPPPPRGPVQTRPAETGEPDAGPTATTCANAPPGSACGVAPQCGCPAASTCDVASDDGATACVPAGRFVRGAPCTATVGCGLGLTCVFGTCHAFCAKPGSACGEPGTGACVQVDRTAGVPIPGFAVCRTACDLRDATACGGTNGAGTGVCTNDEQGGTDCVVGGPRKVNESCTTEDCGPALVCVLGAAGAPSTCKRWCRVGTADCGLAVTCRSFAPKVTVSGVEHGVCP